MNKTLTKLFVTVLVAAMLLYNVPLIMPAVRAQPAAPSIYVLPTTESFSTLSTSVGTTFTVTLWGSTTATDQNGLQTSTWSAELSFDPTMLQCVSVTLTDGANSMLFQSAVADGATTMGLDKVINNTAGTILCGEAIGAPGPYIGAETASLVNIEFNITAAPAPGQTLTCNIDPAYGTQPSVDETYFLDTLPAVAEEAGLSTGYCTYTYQGPVPVSVGSNITVSPTNNLELTFENVTAAGNASADETLTVFAPPLTNLVGEYYNVIVTAGFDNVTVSVAFDGSNMTTQQKSSLQMVQYEPILGDIAAPFGIVDMKDIATVAAAFGSKPGMSNWNPICDLNSDGKVDMKDIAIVAAHFGDTASWVNITTSVDTTNNIIYGSTTHFSFIAIH